LSERYKVVAEAEDGEQALAMYEQHAPDFVTLDITMPRLNGIQVLEKLVEQFPDAKVVIVSAVGQKQLVFKALSMGAKDFILKPFDPERVLKSIDRLFS
jgi:two-component system chemotaxis response regulator CheY